MTTREKIKAATDVMTDKQISALWKIVQASFGIEDIFTRTINTLDDMPELE